MTGTHYYNEIDAYCAQWLQNLMDAGEIPRGVIDTRSIEDVTPNDVAGFTQCHFFAGIGGWALAARLAGWPDGRELWTGSAPCQPFSVAGKQRGADDERHLWPELFRLIDERKPATVMGEQVAAAVGKNWLDGVFADLEGIGYACGAAVVPACAVDAPHRRDRLWFVAERSGAMDHGERALLEGFAGHGDNANGWPQPDRPIAAAGSGGNVANAGCGRRGEPGSRQVQQSRRTEIIGGGEAGDVAITGGDGHDPASLDAAEPRCDRQDDGLPVGGGGELRGSAWSGAAWIIGHDGKARRIEPGICLLANGVPARVGKLRAYGNAIVPQVAAEVMAAFMECRPLHHNVSGSTIRPADMNGDSRGPDPCTSCAQALP